jgi:hypothetical protein
MTTTWITQIDEIGYTLGELAMGDLPAAEAMAELVREGREMADGEYRVDSCGQTTYWSVAAGVVVER